MGARDSFYPTKSDPLGIHVEEIQALGELYAETAEKLVEGITISAHFEGWGDQRFQQTLARRLAQEARERDRLKAIAAKWGGLLDLAAQVGAGLKGGKSA